MQHLNDDMDEIFRKAADDYPLNTGTPDWNKVAEGLSQQKDPDPPVKKSFRKYTWLLLLLPLAFICNEIYNPGLFEHLINTDQVGENTKNKRQQTKLNDREPGSGQQEPELDNNKTGSSNESASDTKASVSDTKETASHTKQQTSDTKETASDKKETGSDNNESGSDKNEKGSDKTETASDKKETGSDNNESGSDKNINSDSKTSAGQLSKADKTPAVKPIPTDARTGKMTKGINPNNKTPGINQKTSKPGSSGNAGAGIAINPIGDESNSPDFYAIDPYTKTGRASFDNSSEVLAIPLPAMTKLLPGPMSKKRVETKNFYLGLVGGIDMTTISFQQASKIGHQYGGLAGYSFARKWSVELGFFVDKKYYYTDPEYFEKGKLPYRPNSTILSVDGSCSMFEIPVSVKYDITNTYKSNFFITAGLSSYIMKNEDYNILYLYNTSGSQAHHSYTYKNSSTNLFSQIRITGGYALKLPQRFSVRIEPYLNIPVSGVGHGELNLMSGGVNAGIFRRIF